MEPLEHEHSKEAIVKRLSTPPTQSYLRDWIYGGIDGAVTTFAIVSGVVGGHLTPMVILILGFANLLADGFSMAVSNYLGTQSEVDQYKRYEAIEEKHIKEIPDGEKEEVRQIFKNKGLEGKSLDLVVEKVTENRDTWVKTMLQDEYGLAIVTRDAFKAAIYTFLSFLIFGFVPLIAYVFQFPHAFFWSCLMTGSTFFIIGSIKSFWSLKSWVYSGLQTLAIGSITAALAYFVGLFLHLYLT